MDVPITVEHAQRWHPEAVLSIMAKLRLGKSKQRGRSPEELTWKYSWCIECRGYTLGEILGGGREGLLPCEPDEDSMSEDDAVQDRVRRTHVGLQASRGHWWAAEQLPKVPSMIADLHRKAIREKRAEKARYDALPEAEKERQFQEALGALRGTPGFIELRVPPPDEDEP
jgi:hypothetical protein